MLKLTIRPIEKWPGERTKERQRSRFDTSYSETLKLLERELDHLHARNAVLQMDISTLDIKNDGNLRASTRVQSPAIILALEIWKPNGKRNEAGAPLGRYTPLQFPCDHFDDWQDNLRAIALAMEALRKIDRYGVTRSGEQYTGWTALPESGGLQSDHEAAEVLSRFGRTNFSYVDVLDNADAAKSVYLAACRATHPDTGGNQADFQAVQVAWGRLKARHGI
jgi:hypothetical protein